MSERYTSGQAAKKLGLPVTTLSTYITRGKIPRPQSVTSGTMTLYLWTEEEIEQARKLLPTIKNGRRKHSAEKKQLAASNKQLANRKSKPKTKARRSPSPAANLRAKS